MIKTIVLVLIAELWTAAGQVFFKMSTNNASDDHHLRTVSSQISFLGEVLKKPFIWYGLVAFVVGLVFWVIALAENGLSIVFSLGSMQYIFIMVLAHFLLGEKIDRHKVIGTLLVVLGIVLIAIG